MAMVVRNGLLCPYRTTLRRHPGLAMPLQIRKLDSGCPKEKAFTQLYHQISVFGRRS